MDFININPGLKTGSRQAFTIMILSRIFFLTHDTFNDSITWNMFVEDNALKQEVEEILKKYLTNQ